MRTTSKTGVVVGALAALSFGGAQIASGANSTSGTSTSANGSQTQQHNPETVLAGSTADSVKAAILAKLPGATITRMSTEVGGKSSDAYEAHVVKADGTKVEVLLDSAYAVTAVNADKAHADGHGHRHGHRGGNGNGETAVTGTPLTRITAA